MRLSSSLFALSLLHSVRLASGREEIGLYGDLYGEIPRPTSEPLLSRDVFKHGAVLMETRLGYRRNGTSSRNFALGARQVCDLPGARGGANASISSHVPTLVLSCHAPLQRSCPAAPRSIQYVGTLSKLAHCSPLFHRFAAPTLFQPCAAASARSATVLTPAVMMAKSLALIPRVCIPICPFLQASNLLV